MNMNKSSETNYRKPENPFDQSTFWFFAGSFGVFSAGMCGGVFIAMRHLREKENFHFNWDV